MADTTTLYREKRTGLVGAGDAALRAVIRNTAGAVMRKRTEEADKLERIADLLSLRAVSMATLDIPDFKRAAKQDGCEGAVYHAIGNIEGGRQGFMEDGRAKPLVEPHIFSALTFHAFDIIRPDCSYPTWIKYRKGQPAPKGWDRHPYLYSYPERWGLVATMAELDVDAAIGCVSLGRFQQVVGSPRPDMGWKLLKFPSAESLFRKLVRSEVDQLEVMQQFFRANGALGLLKTKNWRKIAEVYNGRDNVDEYAPRLATEYQRLRRYYEQ